MTNATTRMTVTSALAAAATIRPLSTPSMPRLVSVVRLALSSAPTARVDAKTMRRGGARFDGADPRRRPIGTEG